MGQSTISFPPELISNWEREADILLKRIESDTALFCALKKRLAAVEVHEQRAKALRSSVLEMQPSEAILYFAKQFGPISKSKLRETIYRSGYPCEAFGTAWRYYYLLLKRLQVKGRIRIEEGQIMAT